MDKLDLTLREVNEAESYKLTPERYLEIRSRIEQRLRSQLFPDAAKHTQAIEAELKARLIKELKPKIREELAAECQKVAEETLREKIEQEVQTRINGEVAAKVPSPKDRKAFQDFVREAEFEALASATASSVEADVMERWLAVSRTLSTPLSWVWLLATPILGFLLHQRFGFGVGFFAYFLPLVIGAVTFAFTTSFRHQLRFNNVASRRKITSDYLMLADKAKQHRIVTAEGALTRGELVEALRYFTNEKAQLDNKYHPTVKTLGRARVLARDNLMTEMDPETLLRVASDPRAEEFEALDRQEQAKRESQAG